MWSISYRFWVISMTSKAFPPPIRPPVWAGYEDKYRFRGYRFVKRQKQHATDVLMELWNLTTPTIATYDICVATLSPALYGRWGHGAKVQKRGRSVVRCSVFNGVYHQVSKQLAEVRTMVGFRIIKFYSDIYRPSASTITPDMTSFATCKAVASKPSIMPTPMILSRVSGERLNPVSPNLTTLSALECLKKNCQVWHHCLLLVGCKLDRNSGYECCGSYGTTIANLKLNSHTSCSRCSNYSTVGKNWTSVALRTTHQTTGEFLVKTKTSQVFRGTFADVVLEDSLEIDSRNHQD